MACLLSERCKASIATKHKTYFTPSVQSPVEDTPSVQSPVEDTPSMQSSVEDTLSVQSPVEDTPSVQSPVEETQFGKQKHYIRVMYGNNDFGHNLCTFKV